MRRRRPLYPGFTSLPTRLNRSSLHVPWLTGRCDHTAPECIGRIDLFARGDGEGDWHVRELVIPEAHHHVRAATEAGMDRALSEEQAEGRVVRGRGHAPDDIGGSMYLRVMSRPIRLK